MPYQEMADAAAAGNAAGPPVADLGQRAAAANRNAPRINPMYIRPPPQFKSGMDFDVYLQRFFAYTRAINCPAPEQADLLISLLEDKALEGISRTVHGVRGDLDDLIAQLRRAEGLGRNSERYVTELRNRRRLRTEGIWEYHLELHKLAKKAYPNNEAMRNGSLRESFIANINDPYLASRLRELQELGMEQLLDAAITLHGCQTASSKAVNAVRFEDDYDDNQEGNKAQLWQRMDNMSLRLDQLAVNQLVANPPIADQSDKHLVQEGSNQGGYQYQGPRHSFPEPPNYNRRNNQDRSSADGSWVFHSKNNGDYNAQRNSRFNNNRQNQKYQNGRYGGRNQRNPNYQGNQKSRYAPPRFPKANEPQTASTPANQGPPREWIQEVLRQVRQLDLNRPTSGPASNSAPLNPSRPQ